MQPEDAHAPAMLKARTQTLTRHHDGNRNVSVFALVGRPSIISASTSPVPGACDIPHAPCPAAMNTPPSPPPLVLSPPSLSSGIRDTRGRPLDVTGRKHCDD
jgi:hypothetical protein